jgi:hypothetical protein
MFHGEYRDAVPTILNRRDNDKSALGVKRTCHPRAPCPLVTQSGHAEGGNLCSGDPKGRG